jgi:Ran GTPase-activating protein 1
LFFCGVCGKSKLNCAVMSRRDLRTRNGGEGEEDFTHTFADSLYDDICKDIDEKPSAKGKQAFRDKVFEHCSKHQIVLSNSRIGANACISLVKLMKNERIRRLDISNNTLQDYGVLPVLQAIKLMPSIKYVNLACNGIGNQGALEIASLLASNNSLWSMEIGNLSKGFRTNEIESKAAYKLGAALVRNKTLLHLGLKGNPIGRDGSKAAESFAVMLTRNNTLRSLSLEGCALGSSAASFLISAMRQNSTFRLCNLANNGITSEIGPVIAKLLDCKTSALNVLNLRNNKIGTGLLDFARPLSTNQNLIVLDLESNDIGEAGGEALAECLRVNVTLTSLNIANNGITEVAGTSIVEALADNQVLTSLNLSLNPIKNTAVTALAVVLASNEV